MCLYPRIIKNRKYTETIKNGGKIPAITDWRTTYIPVGCQKCMECMKKKKREWQVRLGEEIKHRNDGKFVTLTFSNESIAKICRKNEMINKLEGYERENAIAIYAVRKYTERWRKKHKKAMRHWLITELGGNGTENIHLHGIIWSDEIQDIVEKWKYGTVAIGKTKYYYDKEKDEVIYEHKKNTNTVNLRTINYIIKYVAKTDEIHKEYKPRILCSNGIGAKFIKRKDKRLNTYTKGKTDEMYRTEQGHKVPLPIYYRNKIYTEEQREKLWIEKLDKNIRYVDGYKIDVSKSEKEYYKALESARAKNTQLGYGTAEKDWNREKYEKERANLNHHKRIRKILQTDKTEEILIKYTGKEDIWGKNNLNCIDFEKKSSQFQLW